MEKKTTQNGQKPSQLPVKGGAKALALQVNEAKSRTSDDFDSAADKWLSENPSGAEFNAEEFGRKNLPIAPDPDVEASVEPPPAATPETSVETPPTEEKPGETPQGKTPDAAPTTSQPSSIPSAATAESKPADAATTPAATAAPATAAAQPAAAEPTRLAPEARFLIGDGTVPWTGHQITLALRERADALPQVEEAKNFRQFFGVESVDKAKEAWSPMLDALRAHPERIDFLENALEHMPAEKFQYLVDSAAHYDAEVGAPSTQASAAQPPQAQYAKLSPEDQARLTRIEQAEAKIEAKTQWNYALTTYPVLSQRKDLRDSLIATFNKLYERDPKTTLYDVLELNKSMYEALGIVNHQGHVASAVAEAQPAVATPPVPALNGSLGATPAGTRPTADNAPQKFDDLEDAVENWYDTHK